ncbi:conserved hypothetical protein [Teredinibacter turnerae T7901]|uniref:Uncharacterized protein n=1 Tax=Teredinibacter turnerae (strain ATCC 39867 / T7901) TaxID=377629 RepID=C6AR35_TERTT|nr:conserved hypothetical protein [Teredinibacter turnerae T7901]
MALWDAGFNPRAREERENRYFAITIFAHSFNPRAREEREKSAYTDYALT